MRIAILGLGLIGSSLARALVARQPGVHIAAFDVSHDALAYGVRDGFIHSQHAHAGQAASDADIVVLASPPGAFATLAADTAPFLKEGAIVTDTASVKRHAVEAILPHLPASAHYVPGHPIAGSEHRGVEAGRADLFAGKRVILTPQESELKSEPVARVKALWESVGARIEYMPADLHDRIYAYVSHLPQLVAFACASAMRDVPAPQDEQGMRFTRLMRSDAALWSGICIHNADYIAQALADFISFAAQIEGELGETPAAGGADARLAATLFPRVAATCLIATAALLQELTGVHPARYAGPGFADMTAPAVSNPESALEAISSQHWVIARMLKTMLAGLREMSVALKSGDREKILGVLSAHRG